MDGSYPNSIIITGPTGSGKSELAIRIATELSGEIISVDSMQVYKGMDVGTGKVTKVDQAKVPHHMIDVCPAKDEFDVAKFISKASESYSDIRARGKTAIFCGGTGLYLKAFFQGIGTAPPKDKALRKELECLSLRELQSRLKAIAPHAFGSVDVNNPRRLVRAIEITTLSGQSPTELKSPWNDNLSNWPKSVFIINPDLEDHLPRMERRVDKMIDQGLVDETSTLLEDGILNNPSASQAIGYRQIISYLQGQVALEEAIESIKIKTRQYAKRQRTWFRNQMPPSIELSVSNNFKEAEGYILDHYKANQRNMAS